MELLPTLWHQVDGAEETRLVKVRCDVFTTRKYLYHSSFGPLKLSEVQEIKDITRL